MNEHYKTLGIAPGASEAEIKKAYFKLIREHSPESDPEMFQKIRQAYEQLKDGGAAKTSHPEFAAPENPFAEKMMEQVHQYLQAGNYKAARDICEEGWKLESKDVQFLYYLIFLQRKCGNTGKAVKNAEMLVKIEPENMIFWRELAFSYFDRGFTKKAYSACEKTYELGCRETEFILMFSDECLYRDAFERAWEILVEMVGRKQRWTREEMPDLFEALYRVVYLMQYDLNLAQLKESLELCEDILKKYRIYSANYVPELATVLSIAALKVGAEPVLKEKTWQIFGILEDYCTDAKQKQRIKETQKLLRLTVMVQDERLPEVFQRSVLAYFDDSADEYWRKYMQLDAKLCMIEERTEVLAHIELLQKEYPEYYEKIKDFTARLENEKGIVHLKEMLKKDYDRLGQYYDGEGHYYELYPNEKGGVSQILISGWQNDDMPYVRDGRKIGRNEPCPCGSGKKYKQCCMKKK